MTQRWRPALSLQAVCTQAAWVGVRLMMGYRAIEIGGGPVLLGVLAAAFAIPALVSAVPVGRLTDRVGGMIVVLAGLGLVLTGTVTAALVSLPGALLGAAVVIGAGHLAVMVGQQTFVANVSLGGSSDAAFGTLTAAASVGQLVGPPVVTVAATLASAPGTASAPDTTVGLLVSAVFVIAAVPCCLLLRRVDRGLVRVERAVGTPQSSARQLLAIPGMWRSLVVSGAVLVTVDLMYAFVPVWAVEKQVEPTVVGLLLALRAAVSVVSRLGLARLVGRLGRARLIVLSIAAAVAGLIALPFVGPGGAVLVMFGLGLGLGFPQPLTMAWVAALTPPAAHGTALGMRLTANRLAQVSLPLAVGLVLGPFGVIGIFWANAVVLLAALLAMVGSNADGTTRSP